MAESKKISELKPSQVNDNTEFLVIDDSLGKTNRVSFSSLKDYLEQTGEKGRSGDDGDTGRDGQKGPKGFKGISANDGPKGFPGGEGDQGDQGGPGIKGVKGVKGVKGKPRSTSAMINFRGDSGEAGDSGDGKKGDKGLKGRKVTGAPGDSGSTGLPGENALKGTSGPKGRKGQKGFKGQKGSLNVNAQRGDSGAKGSKSTTLGPKGRKGVNGVNGSTSQYKFNYYHDLNFPETKDGFRFTEGSTLPRYSNDEFVHNNASGGGMRGTNNRFQKISGGNAWNAGIKSKSTKSTNIKAWGLTIVPNVEQQYTMIGLSTNPSADYKSLDYAFYFEPLATTGWGKLTIREKGVEQTYGEESGKIHGIDPNTKFVYLFTPGMQYHIDWDGVNKKIIYRVSHNQTGEVFTARRISCPWVNKNVYAAGCFYLGTDSSKVDATRYLLWR